MIQEAASDRVALRVKDVSKTYDLYEKQTTNLKQLLKDISGQILRQQMPKSKMVQALQDVSFEVHKGDILGVIGDNGSGKSTLLKLISEVSKPSKGQIEAFGNIASILDVGTGFHPELSGRDNIYLSGTIMGMTNKEIDERYENIVAFSGIREFMDTPVKRYSSGMFIRLAFSVVAQLNADIILLDEVISVGDASFRLKSFEKIRELAKSDKTILIISHELSSIMELCNKTLILEKGQIQSFGNTKDVVGNYMESTIKGYIHKAESEDERKKRLQEQLDSTKHNIALKEQQISEIQQRLDEKDTDANRKKIDILNESKYELQKLLDVEKQINQELKNKSSHQIQYDGLPNSQHWPEEGAPGGDTVKLLSIECRAKNKDRTKNITHWDEVVLEFSYKKITKEPIVPTILISYQINMLALSGCNPLFSNSLSFTDFDSGEEVYHLRCIFPSRFLNNGIFSVSLNFIDQSGEQILEFPQIAHFQVDYNEQMFYEYLYNGKFPGALFPNLKWEKL